MARKADRVTIRTSRPKTKISSRRGAGLRAGFTLIEILIVVALIGLIMSVAVPNATLALKVNLSNSSRELATTIRASYDEAILKGTVFRIGFDLEKKQYWVEQGDKDYLIRTPDQSEEEQKRLSRLTDAERKEKQKEPFVMARGITKEKKNLPKGVKFKDIVTAHTKGPTTGGVVYAHVFPHGFVEKLVIHLQDSYDRESTLIVNSVSGKSRLFERYVADENAQ